MFADDLRFDPRPKPFRRAFIEFIRKRKGREESRGKGKVRIWDESAWLELEGRECARSLGFADSAPRIRRVALVSLDEREARMGPGGQGWTGGAFLLGMFLFGARFAG